jgi:hypothetical protein
MLPAVRALEPPVLVHHRQLLLLRQRDVPLALRLLLLLLLRGAVSAELVLCAQGDEQVLQERQAAIRPLGEERVLR